jgi:hypothetical protein
MVNKGALGKDMKKGTEKKKEEKKNRKKRKLKWTNTTVFSPGLCWGPQFDSCEQSKKLIQVQEGIKTAFINSPEFFYTGIEFIF